MKSSLCLLLVMSALLSAEDHPVGAGASLPVGMTSEAGWSTTNDPENPTARVMAFDGTANGGNGELRLSDPLIASGAWVLSFRTRYATEFPGLAVGKQPDGQHFPNWRLAMGEVASLQDSFAWNGLLLEGAKSGGRRIDGYRPQNSWYAWQIACKDRHLQVWLNGNLTYEVELASSVVGLTQVRWHPMHQQFWLGDVRVEAWRALQGNAPELRTPDRPEWHDFADGKLPAKWRPSGPWSVVSDPEDPNNQTLSVVSDRDLHRIQSGTSTYRDYRLTYRSRFASPWKPYPQNDNIHFTHGNISLRGDHLTLDDSLIWNVFMLAGELQNPVVQARQILRDRWQQVEITLANGKLRVQVDGKEQARADFSDLPAGSIGFGGMAGQWWYDDIRLTLHPNATSWETFADGLAADRWIARAGWTVVPVDGNQAAHAGTDGWLSQRVTVAKVMVACAMQVGDGGFSLVLRGDPTSTWFGLRQAGGALELGLMTNGVWSKLAHASATVPIGSTWHAVRAEFGGRRARVMVNGIEVLNTAVSASVPASSQVALSGAGLRIDDLLIDEPPMPLTMLAPLEDNGIFAPGEPAGIACTLVNHDAAPMALSADLSVMDARGAVIGTATWAEVLPAGQRRERIPLQITLPAQGSYQSVTIVRIDGEEAARLERSLLLLPALPSRSPAYRSRFGMVGSLETTSTRKLGAAWVRGGAPFDGLKRTDTGWDFSAVDAAAKTIAAWGINGNALYMNNAGYTADGIRDVAEHFAAAAGHFKGRTDLGYTVWNEPNHGGFWRLSPPNGFDYSAVLIAASRAAKGADPKAEILAPGTSGPCTSYLDEMCKVGGGRYLDVLSYHPYGYPTPPDVRIPVATAEVNLHADRWFSWVDHQHTEMGYPTTTSSSGVSEVDQAAFLVRWQLIVNATDRMRASHFYQMWDCGEDPTNVEHRFGLIRTSHEPKPSFISLATMARRLMNSEFCGTFDAGPGITCQVYRRFDNTLVAVAWAFPKPATASIPVGVDQVRVADQLGVESVKTVNGHTLKLELDGSPVWIEGIAPSLLGKALQRGVAERAERLLKRIELVSVPATRDAARNLLTQTVRSIDQALMLPIGAPRDVALRKLLDGLWSVPTRLAADMRGEPDELVAGLIGEDCYHLTVLTAHALAKPVDAGASVKVQADVEQAAAAISARCDAVSTLTTAARILGKARLHAQAAKSDAASASYAGELELAQRCAAFATAFAKREVVFHPGTIANTIPKYFTLSPNGRSETVVSVANEDGQAADFTIELHAPSTWNQAVVRHEKRLASGSQWSQPLAIVPPPGTPAGTVIGSVIVTRNGKPWREYPLSVTTGSPVAVRLRPQAVMPGKVTQVTALVTNQFTQPFTGMMRLATLDGKALGEKSFTLASQATAEITVPVTLVSSPFNDLKVMGKIDDAAGNLAWQDQLPIDFPLIRRTTTAPVIDGTLSGFRDATAVHLLFGAPLDKSDISAQAWALHDGTNLYLAVKAIDQFHSQPEAGSNMWKGDSLQIGLDPRSGGSEGAYGPDDWEVGVSLSDGQQVQTTTWSGKDQSVMSSAKVVIVRDEAATSTIYTIMIPLAKLGIPSKPGQRIGLNLGLNDADRTFGRAHTVQVTSGVCDAKNPAAWYRWVLE